MPAGRPTKCTEELIARLAAHLEDGLPIGCACGLEGVGETTYHRWRQRGELVERAVLEGKDPEAIDEAEWVYYEFWERCVRARAEGLKKYIQDIRDRGTGEGEGDWRALGFLSERLYPEMRPSAKIEHSGTVATATPEQLKAASEMSDEELAQSLQGILKPPST